MPFPDRPAENADPWYDERETYDQAIEDAVTTAQTKLAGIATGATANDTDANLKARANHTGTQTAATISDFDTEVGNHTDVAANTAARHTHSNSAILAATTASFLTADETKLDGIATGATANATNAELRARSSHTGTQLASTISDLSATVSAVTDVVNNTAARHTHSNSAVLAATTASFLTADETKLDGIATGATANSSDATLLARANHTGTQSADTITDGTANKAYTATEKTKLSGVEALADVTDAANVAAAGALMTTDAAELIRDTMGTALVAGSNVTITPSDGSDTITIAASGGGASTKVVPIGFGLNTLIHGPTLPTTGTINQALALTADTLYLWPIDCPHALTFNEVQVQVSVSSSAGSIRVGVFTVDENALSATLVVDSGTASTTSNSRKDIASAATALTAGTRYWAGAIVNEACTILAFAASTGFALQNTDSSPARRMTKAVTYGTFAGSYTSLTRSSTSPVAGIALKRSA